MIVLSAIKTKIRFEPNKVDKWYGLKVARKMGLIDLSINDLKEDINVTIFVIHMYDS